MYIEFATEEEMREILGDVKGFDVKSGWATRDFKEEEVAKPITDVKGPNYYVFANVCGSRMYIANRGTTYNQCFAKLFAELAATKKVHAMNKCGTYSWEKMRASV